MIKTKHLLFFLILFSLLATRSVAQNSAQNPAYGDSWVAVDNENRILPTFAQCGPMRTDKYVGVFYWLWHPYIRLKSGPLQTIAQQVHSDPNSPPFECNDFYWGEPENGFYHPSDPWSTRRNLQLLANAGVDFIYIDFTNGSQGCGSLTDLMNVMLDMYNKGIPVPKIVFFINEGMNDAINCIMDNVYNNVAYKPLWFMWEGKPLIMGDKPKCCTQSARCCSSAVADFFTWRKTWAFDPGQWNFIDDYPQDFYSVNGVAEQMPVSKSMGAPLGDGYSKGASFYNKTMPPYDQYWETPLTSKGYFFNEQWSRAFQVDPKVVCVTGWNELCAAAWPTTSLKFMNKQWNDPSWRCVNNASCLSKDANGNHIPHGWYFVDEFNPEFNRDIEPMKDNNTDNYYYQLVSNIRKFKGMKAPENPSASKTIVIDGSFTEWNNVTPVFKDAEGDCAHRNFKNVNNSATYINNTGRNDIVESRVTYDNSNIYFYVKTSANLTPSTDSNWMLLYIDSDKNKSTGWEGYDYVINMGVNSASQTTIKSWNGSSWQAAGTAAYQVNGNQMEISLAATAVGQIAGNPSFYFHWNDNPQALNSINEFFINGESAPERRFNYYYSATSLTVQTAFNGPHAIPGTVEAEDFDNGDEVIAYHDGDIQNKSGAYRNDGVDIEACAEGGYNTDWSETGEWMEYTVNVAATTNYLMEARVASPIGGNFHLEFDGTDVTGLLTVPNTGGWQAWTTVKKIVSLTAGPHIMRFYIDQKEFNTNKFIFSIPTGIDNSEYSEVTCYPNPAKEEITINGGTNLIKKISITDPLGRIVWENNDAFTGSKNVMTTELPDGIYFLKISCENKEVVKKLIIDK